MPATGRRPFHFFRKLFFTLLLAAAAGFAWALWETGTPLSSVVKTVTTMFERTGGASPESPAPSPDAPPGSSPPKPPPKTSPAPSPSPSHATGPAAPAQAATLFADVERLLQAGQ